MRGIIAILLVFGLLLSGCTTQPSEPSEWDSIEGTAQSCTDTDGGKEIFVAGTATSGDGKGTDRCLGNGEMVMEYYCDGNRIADEDIPCPEGYLCYDGQCEELSCYDSDEGKVASVAGSIRYGNDEYSDTCLDEGTVKEYYCDGGISEEEISCSSTQECKNGRCVEVAQCSDSDQGIDEYIKGTVTYGTAVYTDSCLSYNVVYEYYCEGGEAKQKQIVCPEGMDCEDGYCVEGPERECEDTDGGKSTHRKGTITYWIGDAIFEETDKCYGQDSVLEVWCTADGGKGFGIIECDSDEWCEDGECISG